MNGVRVCAGALNIMWFRMVRSGWFQVHAIFKDILWHDYVSSSFNITCLSDSLCLSLLALLSLSPPLSLMIWPFLPFSLAFFHSISLLPFVCLCLLFELSTCQCCWWDCKKLQSWDFIWPLIWHVPCCIWLWCIHLTFPFVYFSWSLLLQFWFSLIQTYEVICINYEHQHADSFQQDAAEVIYCPNLFCHM